MKNKLYLLIILFLLVKISSAQYKIPGQKKAIEAKKRTLLIKYRYSSDEELKKMFKKDEEGAERRRQRNISFNAIVEEAVKKDWKLNKDIEFKMPDEFKAALKKDEDKYAVFGAFWDKR